MVFNSDDKTWEASAKPCKCKALQVHDVVKILSAKEQLTCGFLFDVHNKLSMTAIVNTYR